MDGVVHLNGIVSSKTLCNGYTNAHGQTGKKVDQQRIQIKGCADCGDTGTATELSNDDHVCSIIHQLKYTGQDNRYGVAYDVGKKWTGEHINIFSLHGTPPIER